MRPTGTIRSPSGPFRASASRAMRAAPVFSGRRCGRLWLVPSGKSATAAPRGQLGVAARERLVVLRHVGAAVLAAVDGHGAGEDEQRGDDGMRPERALGQEARAHVQEPREQRGVHQVVLVVGDDDERPVAGQAVGAEHRHLPEEDAGQGPREQGAAASQRRPPAPGHGSGGGHAGPGLRFPRRSASRSRRPRTPGGSPPTMKNTTRARIALRLAPVATIIRREQRGPDDPGELLEHPVEGEELRRPVLRDQRGEERAAQRLGAAHHRRHQDRQQQKCSDRGHVVRGERDRRGRRRA